MLFENKRVKDLEREMADVKANIKMMNLEKDLRIRREQARINANDNRLLRGEDMQKMDNHTQVVVTILETKGLLTNEDVEFLTAIPSETSLQTALKLIKMGLKPNGQKEN